MSVQDVPLSVALAHGKGGSSCVLEKRLYLAYLDERRRYDELASAIASGDENTPTLVRIHEKEREDER